MKTERSKALAIIAALIAAHGGQVCAGSFSLAERPVGLSTGREPAAPFDVRAIKAADNCDYAEDSFGTVLLNERPANSFDPAIGCHQQSNLDAMVGNRKDLKAGRGTRYSDGDRAANIVSRYRKGEPRQDKAGAEAAKANTAATAAPKANGQ